MKEGIKRCGLIVRCGVFCLAISTAPSALAYSSAASNISIDWSKVNISTSGMALAWSNQKTSLNGGSSLPTFAMREEFNTDTASWTTEINGISPAGGSDLSSPLNRAYSKANASGESILAYTLVGADAPEQREKNTNSNANSVVDRSGEFTVSGNGTMTVTVPYETNVTLTSNRDNDFADAQVTARISLDNGGTNSFDEFIFLVERDTFSREPGTSFNELVYADSGLLSVSLDFVDGDMGILNFSSAAFSHTYSTTVQVVPIPAALWLFAPGVMGLLAFRRRNNKHV